MQTPTPGTLTRFFAGGWDVSALLRGAKPSMAIKTEDFACFGDAWEKPFAVSENGNVSVEGFYENTLAEDDELNLNETLFLAVGTNGKVITLVSEDVLGKVAYGLVTAGTAYDVSGLGVASIVKISAAFASRVGLERLLVMRPKAALTAVINGAAVDNGAATSYGGVLYKQISNIDPGSMAGAVDIQDSADGTTWADLILGPDIVAPGTNGTRSVVAGTIRRYLRWSTFRSWNSVQADVQISFGRGTAARPITI